MATDALEVKENGGGNPPAVGVSARFWDALGILLCLLLAFCATLFPATNSDLFRHLAIGRQLLEGTYDFKTDPVVFTHPDLSVEHNWLYGASLYLIHSIPTFGPALLVILKALGAAATILLLWKTFPLSVGRMTIPLIAMGLAALGISNRWLLQPFALSGFFLALTLFLLPRIEAEGDSGKTNWPVVGGLLALFALWVNMDVWFFLGPLAFSLFALGRGLGSNSRISLGVWVGLLALAWIVCLANPWGYRAFALPINLRSFDPANTGWKELYPHYFAPALGIHYLQSRVGLNLSGLAFVPIAALGIIMGLSSRAPKSLGIVLVGAIFLFLGLYSSRALPFFCIVGAWAVLGLGTSLANSSYPSLPAKGKPNRASGDHLVFPKVAVCFLLAIALGCAIPGWIHPVGSEHRHFGLGIKPDPSLESLALWVNEKKTEGDWENDRNIFHLSLDLPNYLVWYAPGTKGFLDNRLNVGNKAANDFYLLRKGLRQLRGDAPNESFDFAEVRNILKQWKIGYLIFQEGEGRESEGWSYFNLLKANGANVDILRVSGTTVAVSWREPGEPRKPMPENPNQLAFGSKSVKLEDPEMYREPILTFWKALFPDVVRPVAKDFESYLRLLQFDANEAQSRVPFNWLNGEIGLMALSAASPQAFGNPGVWTGVICTDMLYKPNRIGVYIQTSGTKFWEEANPAYLYLAIRSSRQALAENPNDTTALLRLGQAYGQITSQTLERHHFNVGTPMGMIRQYQTLNALAKVTRLSTSVEQLRTAHEMLMQLYGQKFPDRTLFHLKENLESIKNYGLNLPMDKAQEVISRLQNNLDTLEREVKERSNRFETEMTRIEKTAPAYSSLEKLRVAYQELGLLNAAKDLVNTPEAREQTKLDTSGNIAAGLSFLHMEILMNLGDADTASVLLSEEFKGRFGPYPNLGNVPSYEWFNVLVAASQGRYQVADAYLKECLTFPNLAKAGQIANLRDLTFVFPKPDRFSTATPRDMFALNLGRHILAGSTTSQGYTALVAKPFDFRLKQPEYLIDALNLDLSWDLLVNILAAEEIGTELEICRGFLRLEAGYSEEAKAILTKALQANPKTTSAPVVRSYLSKMK